MKPTRRWTVRNAKWFLLGLFIVVAGAVVPSAPGATHTWNVDDGGWDTVGNWNPAGPLAAGDEARFSTASPDFHNVQLNSPTFIDQIHLTSGTAMVEIWGGVNLTVTTGITVDSGVTANNAGFALKLDNDYLYLGGNVVVTNNGSAGVGSIAINRTVAPSGASRLLTVDGSQAVSIGGVMQDNGANVLSILKQGSGTLTLSSPNTYTGTTTINGGTLVLLNQATIASSQIANNAAVTLANTSSGYTFINKPVAGGGSWTIDGSGAGNVWQNRVGFGTSAAAASAATGLITVTNTGKLWFEMYTGQNPTWGAAQGVNLNGSGSRMYVYGNAGVILPIGSLQGNGVVDFFDGGAGKSLTLQIGNDNASRTFSGVISNSGGSSGPTALTLAKAGSGTQTLSGNNTYTGGTVITGGTLSVDLIADSGTSRIGTAGGNGNFLAIANATLQYTGAGASTTTRYLWVDQGAATFDITQPSGSLTLNPSGGAVSQNVTKNGPGTLALSSVVSGGAAVAVNAGTLTLSGLSTYTGTTTVNGGTLQQRMAGNSPSAGGVVLANGGTLDLYTTGSADAGTFARGITGTGDLTIDGTGAGNQWQDRVILSGANTFTGNVHVVNGGKLWVGGSGGNNIPDSAIVNLAPGAVLNLYGSNETIGGLTGIGTVDVSDGGGGANLRLLVGGGGVSSSFAGTIKNSGTSSGPTTLTLEKTGSGTLTLTGANTYTGGTAVTGGTLSVDLIADFGTSRIGTAGGSGNYLAIANATLQYTGAGASTTTRYLWADLGAATFDITQAAGSLTLNPSGGTVSQNVTKIGPGTLALGGAISGGAAVTVNAGTLTLSGANTYTGTTTINGGTLVLLNQPTITSSQIANNAAVNLTNTSSGYTVINKPVAGGGSWTIDGSGAGNAWQNRVGFTTSAAAASTATGPITVNNAGKLWFEVYAGQNPTWGAAQGVNLNGSGSRMYVYGNAGVILPIGSLQGNGVVDFFDGGAGKALTLQIDNDNANQTFSGVISNSGGSSGPTVLSLAKVGNGTQTLSGNNTYTGATTVNAGKLLIDGSITSPVSVNSGGMLGGHGHVNGAVTVAAGGTVSAGDSPGHLTINGAYNLAGTMLAELGGTTQGVTYDWIEVNGAATLTTGSIVDVNAWNNWVSPGEGIPYYILTATGGISPDSLAGVTFDFSGAPGWRGEWKASVVPYPAGGSGAEALMIEAVPEPATLALLGLAFAGLGGYLRRRRTA